MTGIVFDIDDTLYVRQDMIVKAAEEVLGVKVCDPREFIRIYYEKSDINMEGLESGKISTRDINGWRYIETFKILGLPYSPDDGVKSADKYLELQSHMQLRQDMSDLLDRLSSSPDIKLAILTAGESGHQRNKVRMLGLDRWFSDSDIVVTGETPYTKPDIELYRIMEDKNENTFNMSQFSESVNAFLSFRKFKILPNKGRISKEQADAKAESEYEIFNKTQPIISDFDKEIRGMLEKKKD